MADLTLTEILDPPSLDQIKEDCREELANDQYPITSWNDGDVMRTILEVEAFVLSDLVADALVTLAQQGFPDSATLDDFMRELARGQYGLDGIDATFAQQSITLACATGFGPVTITAGALRLRASDGTAYIATSGGSLSSGGTLAITATAERAGAARALVVDLDEPREGVTVQSAAIAIVSLVPQFGSDAESLPGLVARCSARWPDLTALPAERLERIAKATSTEVTRTRQDEDPTNAGGIIVTIAGPSGAVSGGAVTAVQNAFNDLSPITDYNTAQNAANLLIDAGGTVLVTADREQEVKDGANAAWAAYTQAAQIGAKVFLSKLVAAVMDAGAVDFQSPTLNGNGDVALASNQVPVPNGALDDPGQLDFVVVPA